MRHIWYSFRWVFIVLISSVLFAGCTNPLDKKNVGGLQVITYEAPSSLFLDGQYLDKAPYIGKTIKPGKYTLRIEPDDHALVPYEVVITVRKGLLTVVTWKPGKRPETSGGVTYEMEPISGKNTELSFVTIPDNALIKVDQGEEQFSPLTVTNLEPGHHQFEVTLPSYETQKHTINLVKGYRITITVKLAKSEDTSGKDSAAQPADTTPEATSAAKSASSATPSARSRSGALTPTVTITSTHFYQDGKEVLRIRSTPSPSGAQLGVAEVGSSFPYLNVQQNGWYKIQFNGGEGWASSQYAKLD